MQLASKWKIVRHLLVGLTVIYVAVFYWFFANSFISHEQTSGFNGYDALQQRRLENFVLIPVGVFILAILLAWLFPIRIVRKVFTVIFIILGILFSCASFQLAWESGAYLGLANALFPTVIVGSILVYANFGQSRTQ